MTAFNSLAVPLNNFEYEKEDIKKLFKIKFAAALLQYKDIANHIGSLPLSREFLETSFPKLCNSVRNILNKDDNFFARFFITLPYAKGDIHIDTQKGGISDLRNLALNIPIAGCEGTYHEWYDTGKDPYTEFKHSALYWRNYDSGTLIDRHELLTPTILKVSVPHRIYNPLDSYRVVLSIRTNSDTFNLGVDNTLAAPSKSLTLL